MFKLRIQVVLYKNTVEQLKNLLDSILGNDYSGSGNIQIVCGSNGASKRLNKEYSDLLSEYSTQIQTKFFFTDLNLGHGAMHNKLFFDLHDQSELLLIVNPDGIIGNDALGKMISRFEDKTVGAAEPRQIPLEHPKDFDLITGNTTWISGACLLVRSEIFHDLNGFDPRFFLHCDDIDLSWRIRNLGFNLIYCVDATFFHDKSVAKNGFPILSESEKFFGPLGALLLAHKYGLKKGLKQMKRDLEKSHDPVHIEILRVFKTKIYKTEKIRRDIPTYYHPWKFAKTRF